MIAPQTIRINAPDGKRFARLFEVEAGISVTFYETEPTIRPTESDVIDKPLHVMCDKVHEFLHRIA